MPDPKPQLLTIWPEWLSRTAAPESTPDGGARQLNNLDQLTPGRLARRKGMAPLNLPSLDNRVRSCFSLEREDGTQLIVYVDSEGTARCCYGPVVQGTDLDDFGARDTPGFYENFAEDTF